MGKWLQGQLPSNPKTKPNPNREAIFLEDNCPDTTKIYVLIKKRHDISKMKKTLL